MAKKSAAERSVHRCQACGHNDTRWHGRCPSCGEWNSTVEELAGGPAPRSLSSARTASHLPGAGGSAVALCSVDVSDRTPRLASGIGEMDRVLGGGLVPGSIVLLGGEPGIGKS